MTASVGAIAIVIVRLNLWKRALALRILDLPKLEEAWADLTRVNCLALADQRWSELAVLYPKLKLLQ
jgi:hypothetical protein